MTAHAKEKQADVESYRQVRIMKQEILVLMVVCLTQSGCVLHRQSARYAPVGVTAEWSHAAVNDQPGETSQSTQGISGPEPGVSGINPILGLHRDEPDLGTTPAQSADKYGKYGFGTDTPSGSVLMNDDLRKFFIRKDVAKASWIRSTPQGVRIDF